MGHIGFKSGSLFGICFFRILPPTTAIYTNTLKFLKRSFHRITPVRSLVPLVLSANINLTLFPKWEFQRTSPRRPIGSECPHLTFLFQISITQTTFGLIVWCVAVGVWSCGCIYAGRFLVVFFFCFYFKNLKLLGERFFEICCASKVILEFVAIKVTP